VRKKGGGEESWRVNYSKSTISSFADERAIFFLS